MTIAVLKGNVAEPTGAPGSADVAALVATKLRCVAPMIAVYLTAYLGLSILCGFAKSLLATKVLGPVNLGFALIAQLPRRLGFGGDLRAGRKPGP